MGSHSSFSLKAKELRKGVISSAVSFQPGFFSGKLSIATDIFSRACSVPPVERLLCSYSPIEGWGFHNHGGLAGHPVQPHAPGLCVSCRDLWPERLKPCQSGRVSWPKPPPSSHCWTVYQEGQGEADLNDPLCPSWASWCGSQIPCSSLIPPPLFPASLEAEQPY